MSPPVRERGPLHKFGDFCSTVSPSGYSFVQGHFSPLHMLLSRFWSYTAVCSWPAPLQRWVSFVEILSVREPFFLFALCAIRSNWHVFGFTQGETEEVAWRVEPQTVESCMSYGTQQTWWSHVSTRCLILQPKSLQYWATGIRSVELQVGALSWPAACRRQFTD
jgi:hypothetical protein